MEMRLLLAFALFLTSFAQDDYYCVVKDSGLVGAYAGADEAKSAMASFSGTVQRAAFLVSGGVLNRDPHNVADSRGNLQKNGGIWNKFWWNWNTINAMADVAEGSSECMDFKSLENPTAVTWTHVGYGGCTGGNWMNIGTANSLKEAKELMLSDERCNSNQAKLFYSAYSYTSSWGVRCATKGNYEDCTEQNTNWQEYIVRFDYLEYTCQKYYAIDDCSGKVIGMATKKYGGCQPYLFEADAAGKYFDLLGRGGHCDKTCTHCEVEAPAITTDIMVGGKNPICRSRKYLGISDETSPTWNFTPGPCPNLCEQFYAMHPGCNENYDGDLPCQPTQEEFDYAPQCFKRLQNARDFEYTCQRYYATDDCTGKVIGEASKKYGGCQPYLFEPDAAGKYFDLLGRGGHCDKTCTHCEVEAPAITPDIMVGGKNPICRSQKYLGLSDDTSPTWNFVPGPCPNLCERFYAMHPGCDENHDGNLPCQPTQEEFDYAPQCFKLRKNTETSLARQNQRLAQVNKALREALQTLQN